MNEKQLKLAANSIAGLADVSEYHISDILDCLSGSIFSEEEVSDILEYFEML